MNSSKVTMAVKMITADPFHTRSQPARKAKQTSMVANPSPNRAGNHTARFCGSIGGSPFLRSNVFLAPGLGDHLFVPTRLHDVYAFAGNPSAHRCHKKAGNTSGECEPGCDERYRHQLAVKCSPEGTIK
jgi:hypothetical protein